MALSHDETISNVLAFHLPMIHVSDRRQLAQWYLHEDRLSVLFLCVHQSHPTQQHIAQSLDFLGLSTDSFPVSMFKKRITRQELGVIQSSDSKEQAHAALFMITLLHFADMYRRGLSADCKSGSCHHSWHSMDLRSESALHRVLSEVLE